MIRTDVIAAALEVLEPTCFMDDAQAWASDMLRPIDPVHVMATSPKWSLL